MTKNNKWMPTADEVYKAIRAFNERLRQARIHFGETSTIFKLMKDRAQRAFGLKWTKTMGISKSKKNIETILSSNFNISSFRRYVKENTVDTIVDLYVTPDVKKSISKLPSKHRYAYLEAEVKMLKHFDDLYDKIYHDMYNSTYSIDECNTIYNLNVTGEYNDLVEEYGKGQIDLDTYVNEMLARRYGGGGGFPDDDDDDDIDYDDFLPPKE